MNDWNKEISRFLQAIGVDVRFISLWNHHIFINNLKFSRFSRKKEELFQAKFPDWKVVRSKIFQMMCIRASRGLSKSINPRDKIYLKKGEGCADLALYMILEPYTRKYGIEIQEETDANDSEGAYDSVASPLTLDREVENIINKMVQGEKIELMSSNVRYNGVKIIYPLINLPQLWIESWAQQNSLLCSNPANKGDSEDLIAFLEEFVPQVRENMLKSALYLAAVK